MMRTGVAASAAFLSALVLAGGASASPTATPTLVGTTGPGFAITVTIGGKKVQTLKAGTYQLVIHDKAAIHSFALDGPHGYAKDFTTVPFVGTKTFSVKLVAGKYKAYCKAHEPTMFQFFTVK